MWLTHVHAFLLLNRAVRRHGLSITLYSSGDRAFLPKKGERRRGNTAMKVEFAMYLLVIVLVLALTACT
jgi:hypothetical protein